LAPDFGEAKGNTFWLEITDEGDIETTVIRYGIDPPWTVEQGEPPPTYVAGGLILEYVKQLYGQTEEPEVPEAPDPEG
jgi:hypothetical protein